MVKKMISLFLLLLIASSLFAAEETGSPRIDVFDDALVMRAFFRMPSQAMYIEYLDSSGNSAQYTDQIEYWPNVPLSGGLDISYKSYGFSFSGKLGGSSRDMEVYGKTKYHDFQMYHYARKFGVDMYYQNYRGFYLDDARKYGYEQGDPQTIRPDLKIRTMGLNTYYIFSDDFSYSASVNQQERQSQWDWTFLLMGSVNYFRINSSGSLIPAPQQAAYDEYSGYSGGRYASLGISPGLALIVPIYHFYLSGTLFVGGGVMNKRYDTSSDRVNAFEPYLKVNLRLGCGYNGDSFFAGMNVSNDATSSDGFGLSSGLIVMVQVLTVEFFAGTRI
jgi:hypothetical protein